MKANATLRIAVTGAFGYSGRYITKRLLAAGHEVITLTNSLKRPNPFGEKVKFNAGTQRVPEQAAQMSARGQVSPLA